MSWPARDERSLVDFYGPPGEQRLVRLPVPYRLRLAWDPTVSVGRISCHELVAASLGGCLEALRDHYGLAALSELRLDHFGGCYSYRKMRGGTSWSLHAWGAAIDLDPVHNGLHTPWPEKATMPLEAIEIFEAAGWLSGARAWGRDAMHFQATA